MIKLTLEIYDGYLNMSQNAPQIATVKNQWLYQQVDVEFPTQESLKGRDIYQTRQGEASYQRLEQEQYQSYLSHASDTLEIYLVDFHRLTVMFALLQAKRWQDENEQQLIIEFLTQIIYSEPCELYLAFEQGEAVATAIVTQYDNELLVSDIYVEQDSEEQRSAFIGTLLSHLQQQSKVSQTDTIHIEN